MPNFTNVNIVTPDGQHLLTACHGGGIGFKPGNGLVTNIKGPPGPYETFQLNLMNATGQFYLLTANNYLVTAAYGGGIGNATAQFPERDPGDKYPLHTNAVPPGGPWENFTFNVDSSGYPKWTVTIQAPNGDFLSAVNGGDIGEGGANYCPIHTDIKYQGEYNVGPDEGWWINQVLVYSWVQFTFKTGANGLSSGTIGRGPSTLSVTFNCADGRSFVLDPVNVINSVTNPAIIPFPSNSLITCWVQLPTPVTSDYLTQMTLTLVQSPYINWPANPDNCDIEALSVKLFQNAPPAANVANPPMNPEFLLVGETNAYGVISPEYIINASLTQSNPSEVINLPDLIEV